ncbi:MAG: NAD-dependent epimerase/dehydratase family protein [Bacteriovorax sp.]|nr:NAD-dependent epimerase/dehydratase family protein [Bacteriovorax sp.]
MIVGITGGLGLVGKALRGKLTTPLVLLTRREPADIKSNEKLVIGNFADKKVADEFVKNLDVLIHAATGVGPRSEFEERYISDDFVGTIELARSFFSVNPKGHFIYLSTAGGLYDLEDPGVKTEVTEVHPKVLYGAIKLLVEDTLSNLKLSDGKISILRASALYGDSLRENQTVGLIDKLLKSTIENTPVPIFDKMESARDYLHVEDLVSAILSLVSKPSMLSYEIYNVGTGIETSIVEVIKLINSISESQVKVEFLPTPNKRTSLIVNSEKIKAYSGWESTISLREGVIKMYQELKTRNL